MKYIEYINKQNALNYLCNIAYERGLSVNNLIGNRIDKGNFSRMRRGKSKITLDIIMYLSNRLDENLEDVLRNSSSTDPDFFEAIDSLRFYIQIHDFDACNYLLNKIKIQFEDEILKSIEVYQLTLCCEAIMYSELKEDHYTAIDKLNEALSINNRKFNMHQLTINNYSELELGIINTILICQIKIDKFNSNIKTSYEKIISYLEKKSISDYEIAFNIYYNYLMVCIHQEVNVKLLLPLAEYVIELAIENGITNKLPFIYFQTALLYTDNHQLDKAEEYFNSSIFMLRQIKAPENLVNSFTEVKHKCLGRK